MYEGSSLGRILVEINSRGQSLGKNVTQEGVNFLQKKHPNDEIIIPEPFYANYNGFSVANGVKIVPIFSSIDGVSLEPFGSCTSSLEEFIVSLIIVFCLV